MDAKYLAEIKAREQAATKGPWYNFGDWMIHTESDVEHYGVPGKKVIGTVNKNNADFIAHARTDIPALLAEVERLSKMLADSFQIQLLNELDAKDQQIAKLNKALELMSRTACGETAKPMSEWDMVGCVPDKSCMKENPCKGSDNECHECWMRYFIQQAQEEQADHAE